MDLETQDEIRRLNQVVDEFAGELKAHLREQAMKGYRGWDDPRNYRRICKLAMTHAAVASGQEVGAAHLAMILWYLRKQACVE